jgi:hypothetical protein
MQNIALKRTVPLTTVRNHTTRRASGKTGHGNGAKREKTEIVAEMAVP